MYSIEDDGLKASTEDGNVAKGDIPNFDAYHSMLVEDGIDPTAAGELLAELARIFALFVQIGIDLKGVDVCGQLFEEFTEAARESVSEVESPVIDMMETANTRPEEDRE